jgi:putative endonuclease
MSYSLYIVECADGTFYTGIATDVQRRLVEHNGGDAIRKSGQAIKGKGARYTSARRPVVLVFEARFATRSDALKEEMRIKRLTRVEKQALIAASGQQRRSAP